MRRAGLLLFSAALLLSAGPAQAVTALRTTASAHRAEVGEAIRIEVSALSDTDDSPTNPRLPAPPGFSVQGPSVSSSQQISFSNGHFEHRRGITATWIVVGTRPGRFVIGPATVEVGKGTVQGERVDVEIVAEGAIPRATPPRNHGFFDPNNPFDPFSMLQRLPGMNDLNDLPLLDSPPDAPSEYLTAHASEPMAFLRATVAPVHAIVGEQVTFNAYAYAARGPYDEASSAEPSRADFLSHSLIDSSFKQPRHMVSIDGSRWSVVKLRQIALFPLHAGTLTVGPMRMGFRGPGYPETSPGKGLLRESAPLSVVAVEPPVAGRPPGYELGDVGTYTLGAEVEPRRVEAGDAVAVTIRLEGTGNVPHHVKVPEATGVDWLDPTITEGITANDSVVGGYRQFRYVVRLEEPGTRDLGDVTLPYYDAHLHRYDVARARLGTVEVVPGKTATLPPVLPSAGAEKAPRDPFEGIAKVRKTLGPAPAPPRHLADGPVFWAFLFGAPGAVAMVRALIALFGRLARRARERTNSGAAKAAQAVADARRAAASGDGAMVAAAVERAIYTAIEDRLGVKARAVLRAALPAELERQGADVTLAKDVVHLLDECDARRFTTTAELSPEGLVDRSASIVGRLGRVTRAMDRAP